MAINEAVTHTISAEWKLEGSQPTAAEIIKIAQDLNRSSIPRNTVIEFEPAYSDTNEYPARFFIKPFQVNTTPQKRGS